MSPEPVLHIPAQRGSDAWQEGRQFVEIPATELTEDEINAMDASERAFVLQWLDRHYRDHEQATDRETATAAE